MIILFNIFYIEKWLKQGQKVRVQAHSVSKWQKQGEIKVCANKAPRGCRRQMALNPDKSGSEGLLWRAGLVQMGHQRVETSK